MSDKKPMEAALAALAGHPMARRSLLQLALAGGAMAVSPFAFAQGTPKKGGTLTIGADGAYTYAVDNANAAVQALRLTTNTLQDSYTYEI